MTRGGRGRVATLALAIALAIALTIAQGCASKKLAPGQLTPGQQLLVLNYLVCVECMTPLDSVRALAVVRPEATVDSLNSALLNGLGQRDSTIADSLLQIGYGRDSTWRSSRGLSVQLSRSAWVSEEKGRYVDGYRARGAMGMGWIHTPRAVQHLDSAMTISLPATVKQAVVFARDSLPHP